MPKRKRLSDLFQVGRLVTITETTGEEIFEETVWLQKLNTVELDQAWRTANGLRARLLAAKTDKESTDYLSMLSTVLSMGDDPEQLIEYVLQPERAKAFAVAQAELSAADEWFKDDYLQGLHDAWNIGGLKERYLKDSEDAEAARVWTELRRFNDAVDAIVASEIDDQRASYEGLPLEELRGEATQVCIDQSANAEWAREYNRMEVWLGTRESDDHSKRYFASREEVDGLSPVVLGRLQREFEQMRVDVIEGKGSQETRDSSPSSEPVVEEETPVSSGLVGATT